MNRPSWCIRKGRRVRDFNGRNRWTIDSKSVSRKISGVSRDVKLRVRMTLIVDTLDAVHRVASYYEALFS